MIEKILNYVIRAKERLIYQYQNKPKIEALLSSFAEEIQELENVFFDILDKRSLYTAEGKQLDLLGTILDLNRQGLDDDEYRLRLKTKIIQNTSFGETERIINIFMLIVKPNKVFLDDVGYSEIIIGTDHEFSSQSEIDSVKKNIEIATAATVRLANIITFDIDEAFSMDGDSVGLGFGDDMNPEIGGKLAFDNF